MSNQSAWRQWQLEAADVAERVMDANGRSVFIAAGPGSGKTRFALECVSRYQAAFGRRGLIGVPTRHLESQWAIAGEKAGICIANEYNLAHGWPRGAKAIVATYAKLSMNPHIFAEALGNGYFIGDEVHHIGSGSTWEKALHSAKGAAFLLMLSGTAFRSDDARIPYLCYDDSGQSQPDYSYSYGQAVADGVCRPSVFIGYGGEVAWKEGEVRLQNEAGETTYYHPGYLCTSDFSDDDPLLQARRLAVAVDPASGWIVPMLEEAQAMLLNVRREFPDAGGLITVPDQQMARAYKVLIERLGATAVLVISDEPEADQTIRDFDRGHGDWIVTCKKVSEGVDLPRLRVGVYATTIVTRMFLRQFVGRFVRERGGMARGMAYVYYPADPTLRLLVAEIEQEVNHFVSLTTKGGGSYPTATSKANEGAVQVLSGQNNGVVSLTYGGYQLPIASPMLEPQQIMAATAVHVTTEVETRKAVQEKITQLVNTIARKSNLHQKQIYRELNMAQRVQSQTNLQVPQLQERVKIIERLYKRYL